METVAAEANVATGLPNTWVTLLASDELNDESNHGPIWFETPSINEQCKYSKPDPVCALAVVVNMKM